MTEQVQKISEAVRKAIVEFNSYIVGDTVYWPILNDTGAVVGWGMDYAAFMPEKKRKDKK